MTKLLLISIFLFHSHFTLASSLDQNNDETEAFGPTTIIMTDVSCVYAIKKGLLFPMECWFKNKITASEIHLEGIKALILHRLLLSLNIKPEVKIIKANESLTITYQALQIGCNLFNPTYTNCRLQ